MTDGAQPPIHVRRMGAGGLPVVLVHGAMTTSAASWGKQEPLAARWTLVIPDRRGYEPNPPADRSDFEVDAGDIATLFGGGAHLVGHSYGAICAMFAAARRPHAVWSLTLIEPPAHALMRGDPEIETQIAAHAERIRTIHDPELFMRAFLRQLGAPTNDIPSPLPLPLERQVRLLMAERPPWDAEPPVGALRDAGIPVWIVSGAHDPAFERVFDRLADVFGPQARRSVIEGRGHVVQRIGEPFNEQLEEFLLAARPAPHDVGA